MLAILAMSATSKTLVVAVVGIVVSGLLGPAATAWATRRANRQQFDRDQRAKLRGDFRDLIDDAAKLLGAGVTNLRIGREAKAAQLDEPDEVKAWATEVHLLKQRLLLRRAADDPVLTSYGEVLSALEKVGAAGSDEDYEQAVTLYEQSMDVFLASARSSIELPVS